MEKQNPEYDGWTLGGRCGIGYSKFLDTENNYLEGTLFANIDEMASDNQLDHEGEQPVNPSVPLFEEFSINPLVQATQEKTSMKKVFSPLPKQDVVKQFVALPEEESVSNESIQQENIDVHVSGNIPMEVSHIDAIRNGCNLYECCIEDNYDRSHTAARIESAILKVSTDYPKIIGVTENARGNTIETLDVYVSLSFIEDEDPKNVHACTLCTGCFYSAHTLQSHHNNEHCEGKESKWCATCQRNFQRIAHLRQHLNVHDGLKPFFCSECGRGFAQKSSLLQHMLLHTGEKRYQCEDCKKRFTRKSSVVKHMRRHVRL